MNKKLSDVELKKKHTEKLLNGVNLWTGFYRSNPHRFAKDYLNMNLRWFQKILLYQMMINHHFIYLASRGQGKTWLTALFCVIRCILYPGTKICIASGTRGQANEVLSKIEDDFCKAYGWGSDNLWREIEDIKISANKASVEFFNGSWIKVVTSSDSARGHRANIIIIDEFRMVDLNIINTVLKKFLATPRQPQYLTNPKYVHLKEKERNKEIYMSSCWYKSHWSYEKVQAYVTNMLDSTKGMYFVCALPYQLAIMEGLLLRSQVEEEMSETDFNQMTFDMEMGCKWFGDTDESFFSFDDIVKCRRIKTPLPRWNEVLPSKIPKLEPLERRILSADIAIMRGKNNDTSSIIINRAIVSNKTRYIANVLFSETHSGGLTTDELGLMIMRYFYYYNCTDLALDCNGVGAGVYDFIIKDQFDPETNETYPALSCINDPKMAERCKVAGAKKVVWSIKASESMNTEICTLLRGAFQTGKINLLVSEYEGKENIKGYSKLNGEAQAKKLLPYIETTLLVGELINLKHVITNTNIKIKNASGMRKDRYSSLGYNYWVMVQIERQLKPKVRSNDIEIFNVGRKPVLRKY